MNKLTREEHLLLRLGEECNEVAKRVSKAVLFTPGEVQPGQEKNNAERLSEELDDLLGVLEMLISEGFLRNSKGFAREDKKVKVEKYIKFSDNVRSL